MKINIERTEIVRKRTEKDIDFPYYGKTIGLLWKS